MPRANSQSGGFTLIEIMTAASIFLIVMTVSMGSIISIFEANRKTHTLRTALANLNLAVETMAREMRFGERYHCGAGGTLTVEANCPSGDSFISFLSSDDEQITYRQTGVTIEKEVNSGGFVAVTTAEVEIGELAFYVVGAGTGDALQPKVLIKINGSVGTDKSQSSFSLQTMVSQRTIDLDI